MEIKINKKYCKKLVAILLVTILLISCTSQGLVGFAAMMAESESNVITEHYSNGTPTVWDGSIERPTKKRLIDGIYYFEISTPNQLAYIAQTGDEWAEYNYILLNDIVLNDEELTYDEHGNITIDTTNLHEWSSMSLRGTFDGNGFTISGAYIDSERDASFFWGGTVINLNLTNAYIKGHGMVAGYNAVNITNCTFDGAIVNTSEETQTSGHEVFAAGFSIGESSVYDSINYGDVFGKSCTGGICADNEYYNGEIVNCINYGKISSSGDYVGGITGIGSAENCKNYGDVIGGNFTGGIVGAAYNEISYCDNFGDVSGENYVGGVAGSSYYENFSNISNAGDIMGLDYVGGIIGSCYYYNHEYFANSGQITGVNNVGGLIGYFTEGTLSSGKSVGIVEGETNVGALVGYSDTVWGRGTASELYYLKTDNVNADIYGFGNCEEDIDGVTIPCDETAFCLGEDGYLSVYDHSYFWCYNTKKGCLEEGSKYFACSNCGDVSKLGIAQHLSSEWIVDVDATSTTNGIKHLECVTCGETLETEIIPKNNYNISVENATLAINRATMFASEESYNWERTCYVVEYPSMYDDKYEENNGLLDTLAKNNNNNFEDSLYNHIGGIGTKSARVYNGIQPSEMESPKYLLKAMNISNVDVVNMIAEKNGSQTIYEFELQNTLNPDSSYGALNRVTNDFLDEDSFRYYVAQYASDVFPGISVYCENADIEYKNITVRATIENCCLKNVEISYIFEAEFELYVLGANFSVANCTFLIKEQYSDFEYRNTNVHDFGDIEYITPPTCDTDGIGCSTCLICGEIEHIILGAIGHEYRNGVCINCGHTVGAPILNGWQNENGKWAYYENGTKVKSTWKADSKGWCYLDADGYMATNKWIKDSLGWCYVGKDGYCLKNAWAKDGNGWCYLGADCRMVYNKWVYDSGKWYFINASGYMVANQWVKDSQGWCYLGANGAMLTNAWVKDSVGWCYVGDNGYCITNAWKQDSKGWCYLDANGRMVVNNWVKYNNKWYYLDGNGYMVTGTKKINGKTYKFDSNGVWVG